MDIITLCTNSNTYSVKRLKEECRELVTLNPYDTNDQIELNKLQDSPESLKNDLIIYNRISGILYDDKDLQVMKDFQAVGHRTIGDITQIQTFRCKWSQFLFYDKHNLRTIPTMNLLGTTEDKISEFMRSNSSKDFFIKPHRSNQGRGIIIRSSLKDIKSEIKDMRYVLQPEYPKTHEYRFLILFGRIIGIMKKTAKNTRVLKADSSKIEILKTDDLYNTELDKLVQRTKKLINLPFYALDIASSKEASPVILELNTCPGFETFEKYSNINIAKSIIEGIKLQYLQ